MLSRTFKQVVRPDILDILIEVYGFATNFFKKSAGGTDVLPETPVRDSIYDNFEDNIYGDDIKTFEEAEETRVVLIPEDDPVLFQLDVNYIEGMLPIYGFIKSGLNASLEDKIEFLEEVVIGTETLKVLEIIDVKNIKATSVRKYYFAPVRG